MFRCTDESGTLKVVEVKNGPLLQADLDSNVRLSFSRVSPSHRNTTMTQTNNFSLIGTKLLRTMIITRSNVRIYVFLLFAFTDLHLYYNDPIYVCLLGTVTIKNGASQRNFCYSKVPFNALIVE